MAHKEEQKKPSWDLDTALRHIGPAGRYQILVFFLQGLMYCSLAFHFLTPVFLLDTPAHHCKLPANATKNETIPKVLEEGQWVDDKCNMYVNYSYTNATIPCTNGWEFDKNSGYISTAVTDFQLTCNKNILVEISLMISSGTMVACQIFANKLADVVGRKTVFVFGCTFRMIFGVAKAFSPNMITYIALDAAMQAAQSGFASMLLLLNLELFPAEYRSAAGTGVEFFWLASCLLASLVVYLFRNWRVLQLVTHAPLALGIAYYWLIPESLPWLISVGKYKEAQKILEFAGRFNKRPLPPGFFDDDEEKKTLQQKDLTVSAMSIAEKRKSVTTFGSRTSMFGSGPIWVRRIPKEVTKDNMEEKKFEKEDTDNAGFMDVFKSPKLRRYTIIFNILWLINSIVYSAINMTVTYLSGDRYLNFFLLSLAEVPAVVVMHLALNRFGRRLPLCTFHVIAGVSLLLTLLELFIAGPEVEMFVIVMNFVGKFGITASYCVILVYTPEVYPTSVRSVFYGLSMFFALVGNLIVPYCRPVERNIPGLVRGLCGTLSIVVGIMVLFLPETFRRPLPKTIADVNKWTLTVSKEERQKFKELKYLSQEKDKE